MGPSSCLLGLKVPFDGELTCDHADGLNAGAYRCGQVYGIQIDVAGSTLSTRAAHTSSTTRSFRAASMSSSPGIAGRIFTRDYWPRILGRLQPRAIVASHFDDFLRPLNGPFGFSLNVNLAAWPEEIAAVSDDFTWLRCRRRGADRARSPALVTSGVVLYGAVASR